ncbi:MAG TPA: GerMN domain-containing protein [Gaiellaceae bacterium]|nr:GerMN domain-containing protein [Gaiellaceae bacterium]
MPALPLPARSPAAKRAPALAALAVATLALAAGASHAAGASAHVVSIYAPRGAGGDCTRVLPLRRVVEGRAVLTGAMRALLAGPTKAERARGYGGWFSAATAGHLRGVRLVRGVAYIDFRDFRRKLPNASSSCGSALLLAQLDRTAKQFPTVRRTVYSFGGSPRAFYEWLQREAPAASPGRT